MSTKPGTVHYGAVMGAFIAGLVLIFKVSGIVIQAATASLVAFLLTTAGLLIAGLGILLLLACGARSFSRKT